MSSESRVNRAMRDMTAIYFHNLIYTSYYYTFYISLS